MFCSQFIKLEFVNEKKIGFYNRLKTGFYSNTKRFRFELKPISIISGFNLFTNRLN